MAKKSESTNEKIVRLYKEGHNFDEIARTMAIPREHIPKIIEKYMPDYETYVQPEIHHEPEPEEKHKKGLISNIAKTNVSTLIKRGKKASEETEADAQPAINLEMDENGFVDRTVAGIAQMLKKGRSVADVAEFFNREKSEIKAVEECMGEHFSRMEKAEAAAERKKAETASANKAEEEKRPTVRTNEFATGLEAPKTEKASRPKYTPPTYSKRNDPKPVSASYGLASDVTPAPEVKPAEPVSLLSQPEPTKNINLVAESTAPEKPHEVKLVPDDADFTRTENKPKPSVKLTEDIPEMPSIEPISLDVLDKELAVKAADPVPEIPDIGYDKSSASADNKEENSGMSPMEKMKQFAQEQIALNNQKIEELKTKKVDAENNAFDCNTKVEAMKKQIEDMQAQLLVLIDEKNKAGEIVSGINDEIESINQENIEFGNYL